MLATMKTKPITLSSVEKQLSSYQALLGKLTREQGSLATIKPAKSIATVALTEVLTSLQGQFNSVLHSVKEDAAPLVCQWSNLSEIREGMTVKFTNKRWYGGLVKSTVVGIVDAISIDANGIELHLRQAIIESNGKPVQPKNKEELDTACYVLRENMRLISDDGYPGMLRVAVFLPVQESLRKYYFESVPRLDGEPMVAIYPGAP